MRLRLLQQVKKILKTLAAQVGQLFFEVKYYLYLKKVASSNSELVIFDLDNTLADTFPHILNKDIKQTYLNLPVHVGMLNILNECIKLNRSVIIISARDYRYYFITKSWIQRKVKYKKAIPVFLVLKAMDKLPFLRMASKMINTVTYYDDLTYNHEHGKVKFYTDVINRVRQMPIKYIGYEQIILINSEK